MGLAQVLYVTFVRLVLGALFWCFFAKCLLNWIGG